MHLILCILGEVCSHVAALLFKIEAACKLGYNKTSCTSLPCEWNKSFVDNVSSKMYKRLVSYNYMVLPACR